MATKPAEHESAGKENDEDFVVLETFENMADSGTSNTSTVPEKHAFESLEKTSVAFGESSPSKKSDDSDGGNSLEWSTLNELPMSDSFSSLGDSTINESPYYKNSRFIDKQFDKERKLGLFSQKDGNEKTGEVHGEKGDSATRESDKEFGGNKSNVMLSDMGVGDKAELKVNNRGEHSCAEGSVMSDERLGKNAGMSGVVALENSHVMPGVAGHVGPVDLLKPVSGLNEGICHVQKRKGEKIKGAEEVSRVEDIPSSGQGPVPKRYSDAEHRIPAITSIGSSSGRYK